ncbi:FCD domain-containing protein, partial [Enterocloster citroniae]|uniref:FCD domain-containing protein n=1 Tax=Enterocloster citroniae TaxID=358743 RepID=UPI001D06922A
RTLLKLIRDFESTMYRFRVRVLNTCHDSRILVREHEAIIQGLRLRDADMAVQAVTNHIERQKGMMLGSCIVKQRPDVC